MPKENNQSKRKQDVVVKGLLSGMSGRQALTSAGYSGNTKMGEVLNANGGYGRDKMVKALEEAGATDKWLAESYVEGVDIALHGEEPDINGLAQCLKHVGYLKGYGAKQSPTVAVQINNTQGKASPNGLGETGELIAEVRDLVISIREEIAARKSDGLHLRSVEDGSSKAHQNLVEPSQEPSDAGGGGGT